MTNRKKLENELLWINERLKVMNSVTRHDILNHLIALNGYIDLAGEYLQDPERLADTRRKSDRSPW